MFEKDMGDGVESLSENALNLRVYTGMLVILCGSRHFEIPNRWLLSGVELFPLSIGAEKVNGWLGNEDGVCTSRYKK